MDAHPAENTLLEFVEGKLASGAWAAVDAHARSCDDCRAVIGQLRTPPLPSPQLGLETSGEEEVPEELRPGERISRYEIVRKVGSGGMGVVYQALDPLLNRPLAIKLLRPGLPGSDGGSELHARLLREAKALARLQHPNVVPVHDVGRAGRRLFVAMAFIEGGTLHDWLRGGKRSWREVLEAFLEAGRGLAAAHRARLVHRDFKPANVMVGRDGRIYVTDFGLVRMAEPRAVVVNLPVEAVDAVTHDGVLVGSPAFMSPEQLAGEVADERSDVFSFCVSLWFGLYGERPFGGATLRELHRSIASQQIRPPAAGLDVPAWVQQVLREGLRAAREERPADMTRLLQRFEEERSRVGLLRARHMLEGATALPGTEGKPLVDLALGLLEEVLDEQRPPPVRGGATFASPELVRALRAEGLSVDAREGEWTPAEDLLAQLHAIDAEDPPRARELGRRVAAHLPQRGKGIRGALTALAQAPLLSCERANFSAFEVSEVGARLLRVVSRNAFACRFEHNLIKALAAREMPGAVVAHEPGECREKGGASCTWLVAWSAPAAPIDPQALQLSADMEVPGWFVIEVNRNLGALGPVVEQFGLREGLGRLRADGGVEYDAEAWYSFLPNVRSSMALGSALGPAASFQVGFATGAVLKPELVPKDLTLLDAFGSRRIELYNGRVRFRDGPPPDLDLCSLQTTRVARLPGAERAILVDSWDLWECDFDMGLFTAEARWFEKDAVVSHASGPCRKRGDPLCTYLIRWGAPEQVAVPNRLSAAASARDLWRDPVGRYHASSRTLWFCSDAELLGAAFWGHVRARDFLAAGGSWDRVFARSGAPRAALIDLRRVTSLDPRLYEHAVRFQRDRREAFASLRAMAVVRPPGLPGALVAGFFETERPPYAAQTFADAREALSWLGRSDDALAAEIDGLVEAARA